MNFQCKTNFFGISKRINYFFTGAQQAIANDQWDRGRGR